MPPPFLATAKAPADNEGGDAPIVPRLAILREYYDHLEEMGVSVVQFSPLFEKAIANLNRLGIGKGERDYYLSYLVKVGLEYKKIILKDRREYPGVDGVMRTRAAETWQGAHAVLLEHEGLEGDASS